MSASFVTNMVNTLGFNYVTLLGFSDLWLQFSFSLHKADIL